MATTHYRDRNWLSPWRELDQMTSRLNQMLGDRQMGDSESPVWLPPVNIEETRDALLLTAELPGIRPAHPEERISRDPAQLRAPRAAPRSSRPRPIRSFGHRLPRRRAG